ncbi:unnamed protein product [Adineta steineri]|uniref:CUE domain-containing protein n=1 Tax=Adineta steineri TaxID=433720 RepID=A0A819PYL0_9BILA|nr:unnamed protein product [Adineta steineri]CAF4025614.1 unnamed protein product [Adineta steineri]
MSRVYRVPPPSTARRPPAPRATGVSQRPTVPTTTTTSRGMNRGARAPVRGRTMHTQPVRPEVNHNNAHNQDDRTNLPERTTHVGDGYHMFTPSTIKREQMRRQAENEQRQYEAHIERKRMHGIHEVHRLGGGGLTEDEVRQQQAEKYRREKFARLEKSHQDQNTQLRSTDDDGATGWTDQTREADRRETMDRFLNRFTQQYDNMNISSDNNENRSTNNNVTNSENLAILHEMLPHIHDETLQYHLEIYNGNIDAIVHELLN